MSKKIINLNIPSERVCDTEYLKQQADSFAVRSVLIELLEKEIQKSLVGISKEIKMDLSKFKLSKESVDEYIEAYPETEESPFIFEYTDAGNVFYKIYYKAKPVFEEETFHFEHAYFLIKIKDKKLYRKVDSEQEWKYEGEVENGELIPEDDFVPESSDLLLAEHGLELVDYARINCEDKKYGHVNLYIKISENRYVEAQMHAGTFKWRIKKDENGYIVYDNEGKYYPACQYKEETLIEFAEKWFDEETEKNYGLDAAFDDPDEYGQMSNPYSIPYVSSCDIDYKTGEIKGFCVKVTPSKRYVDVGIQDNNYYIKRNNEGLSVHEPYSCKYYNDTQYNEKEVIDAVEKYMAIVNGDTNWNF